MIRRIWVCFVAGMALYSCVDSAFHTKWALHYATDRVEFLSLLLISIIALCGVVLEFKRNPHAPTFNVAVPCLLGFLVIFDAFASQVAEASIFSVVPFFFATVTAVLYASTKNTADSQELSNPSA